MNRRKVAARSKHLHSLKHIQDNEQCAEQNKGLKWKGLKVKKQSPQSQSLPTKIDCNGKQML